MTENVSGSPGRIFSIQERSTMSRKKKYRDDWKNCGGFHCPPQCEAEQASGCCTLNHLKVALIGGLDRLENQYRSVFESLGTVKFYFHTGCCNGSGANRLRASAQDADIVVFITRVNSHNALSVIKGICRKSGKSFLAIRETNPSLVSKIVLDQWQNRRLSGCVRREKITR